MYTNVLIWLYMGDFTQGGEWLFKLWLFLVLRQTFFSPLSACGFFLSIDNYPGEVHNFFLEVNLLNFAKTALELGFKTFSWNFGCLWLQFENLWDTWRGIFNYRFKKTLTLSFQNTHWITDLKKNYQRKFNFKQSFFCKLGSVRTLVFETFLKLGKLQCKYYFNKN